MIEILQPSIALQMLPKHWLKAQPSYFKKIKEKPKINKQKLAADYVKKLKEFIGNIKSLEKLTYSEVFTLIVDANLSCRPNSLSAISVQSVKKLTKDVLKEKGITRQRTIRPPQKNSKLIMIATLLSLGKSAKEIAEISGAHPKYVYRIKKQIDDEKLAELTNSSLIDKKESVLEVA